jgi:dodecin
MSEHVFKIIEVVGTSKHGVGEAVQNAITRASKTMRHIGWFEASQIRGSVVDGKISEFQVQVRIGFRMDD